MAGCSNARCSSERRSLRRELDHWRKDLITCVGLESFAEFLMGPDRFKEVMPFNGFEAVECADWEPTSECRLCHARREVVTESLEHHRELIERQRTRLEENSSQDYPGSYVPFKFSSAQEAIRHLASHHASKQQQSSQSALQEDSDNLDSDEDDSPPSPQHDSFNGSGAKRLRNSPCWLKIPRVPFGHEAKENASQGGVEDGHEDVHSSDDQFSIPGPTLKKMWTSSTHLCDGADHKPNKENSYSIGHTYQQKALGQSSDKNVPFSQNIPSDSSDVELQNLCSNSCDNSRCLDEDFLLWVIYCKGRRGKQLFGCGELEMNDSEGENGDATAAVSQVQAAVLPADTDQETMVQVHNPPTSADSSQETPSQQTSTSGHPTSNLKTCQNSSSVQETSSGPSNNMLRDHCSTEASQDGAKNDAILNFSGNGYDIDCGRDGVDAQYLFKPINLSSDALPSLVPSDTMTSRPDEDSDMSSCCSISPPSLSPVTGYDTCSERDQSQSSVYSLEENEDEIDEDDLPPPILSPMPTMSWSITFCPALRKEPQSGMSDDKEVCKTLFPTEEDSSMGRDSGFKSCSSSKSTETSVDSNENSTDSSYSCSLDGGCSSVVKEGDSRMEAAPQPSKTLSNKASEDQSSGTLSCTDKGVKVEVTHSSEKPTDKTSTGKDLACEQGPQHALEVKYLPCLPHRPVASFTMFAKRKCKEAENRHVRMGHYLLNKASVQKASLTELQLKKSMIVPCHVRLRKLSNRQILKHKVQPKTNTPVLSGRHRGRPRKWMWIKGKSGKLVKVLIPKKEVAPSGVGDVEVLRKLRPSAQRVVREAQLKTDQVPSSKKEDNSGSRKTLRPLPVRLAKINERKFQTAPKKCYIHKGNHLSGSPDRRKKTKPIPGSKVTTSSEGGQSEPATNDSEDDHLSDVKQTKTTGCPVKKSSTVRISDLQCSGTCGTAHLAKNEKVENYMPLQRETAAAGPKLRREERGWSSQMSVEVKEEGVKKREEMKRRIRTLPHRRARVKVLKAFHTVILKRYQQPESVMPAAIRKLRQLPSRDKLLKETTNSKASYGPMGKTSKNLLQEPSQMTTDCEISQNHYPKREIRKALHVCNHIGKDRADEDGNEDALIKHSSKTILENGIDVHYDDEEEQTHAEHCSVIQHPLPPHPHVQLTTEQVKAQSQLSDVSSEPEETVGKRDVLVVKKEHDHPRKETPTARVDVYEKRQLRVLPERVSRLREQERRQEAQNAFPTTTSLPSLGTQKSQQNKSQATDGVNPPGSSTTSAVVLNGKIESTSNAEEKQRLKSDAISARISYNSTQEKTVRRDVTCKTEGDDFDDARQLRGLPCRMVAQCTSNAWAVKRARGRPRKHLLLPPGAEPPAKRHRGRPRKHLLPDSLQNATCTKTHTEQGVNKASAAVKRKSLHQTKGNHAASAEVPYSLRLRCETEGPSGKSDDGVFEEANSKPPILEKESLQNTGNKKITSGRQPDTTCIAVSTSKDENTSNTESSTQSMDTAESTCGFLMKRKVSHCPKTDLRYECRSLDTSLTLQYQDAIISKGWVRTSEKPGRANHKDNSLIQSLFTQPVTYDTIIRLVAAGSNTGLFPNQEQVTLTQESLTSQAKKGHLQHTITKGLKTKKKGFEELSVTKDLAEEVPISPSKPITMPSATLRAARQERTPKTKINRQADRLRKTLRKFATVTPAKNRIIPYEDVGRRKCKVAKKLFIVPTNPSILWCHQPSNDCKTKGPKAKNSPKLGSVLGAKDAPKSSTTTTTTTTTPNTQSPTKGRTENTSNVSSTTPSVSTSPNDKLSRDKSSLVASLKIVKKSETKKTSKKCSSPLSPTSVGITLKKVKSVSIKKDVSVTATSGAEDGHNSSTHMSSNTAQASRSSARIQKKRLLGFSICPCCALVDAEHFERFKKRVKNTESKEKHPAEKPELPAQSSEQGPKKEAKKSKKVKSLKSAIGAVSEKDKAVSLAHVSKLKKEPTTTKGETEKLDTDESPQDSGRSVENIISDDPLICSLSGTSIDDSVNEDVSCHVPEPVRSSLAPPVILKEQLTVPQWRHLTQHHEELQENSGTKDQITRPEQSAVVQNGKVFPDVEDMITAPCEKNDWHVEEEFAGPLDLRVSWKKSESH